MPRPQIEPSSRPRISPHPPRTEDNIQDDLWFGLNRHDLRAMISLKSYAAPEDLHLAKVVDGHGEVAEDLQRGVLFRPAGGGPWSCRTPHISMCGARWADDLRRARCEQQAPMDENPEDGDAQWKSCNQASPLQAEFSLWLTMFVGPRWRLLNQ